MTNVEHGQARGQSAVELPVMARPRVTKVERPPADCGRQVAGSRGHGGAAHRSRSGTAVNLVDLGLITTSWCVGTVLVYIEMTLTTPACPVAGRCGTGAKYRFAGARCERGAGRSGLVAFLDARPDDRSREAGAWVAVTPGGSSRIRRVAFPTARKRHVEHRKIKALPPDFTWHQCCSVLWRHTTNGQEPTMINMTQSAVNAVRMAIDGAKDPSPDCGSWSKPGAAPD